MLDVGLFRGTLVSKSCEPTLVRLACMPFSEAMAMAEGCSTSSHAPLNLNRRAATQPTARGWCGTNPRDHGGTAEIVILDLPSPLAVTQRNRPPQIDSKTRSIGDGVIPRDQHAQALRNALMNPYRHPSIMRDARAALINRVGYVPVLDAYHRFYEASRRK